MNDIKSKVYLSIVLIWITLGVSLYYLTHKPFTPVVGINIALGIWQIGISFSILAISGGIGTRILRSFPSHPLAGVAVRLTVGIGVLSAIVMLFGGIININGWSAWGLWFGIGLLLRRSIFHWIVDALDGIKELKQGGKLGKSLAWLSGLIFLASLLMALAPPLKFDSLVYHFSLPKMYLESGEVYYISENSFWGFPQIIHMLYLWGLALGLTKPALITWWIGVIAILGLWGFICDLYNPRVAWVGTASLLAGFSLASSLAWGYVDWGGILVGIAFLTVLDLWHQSTSNRFLPLLGAIAGIAVGIKYTYGVLGIAGLFIITWVKYKKSNQIWKSLATFSLWMLILLSPWLLKNLAATGNPIYPLLFPSGEINEVRINFYQDSSVIGDWRDLLLLPLRLTYWGREVTRIGDAPGYEASIGPLLLVLGAIVIFRWKYFSDNQKNRLAGAVWAAGTGIIIWSILSRLVQHLSRAHLYYAIFPALAVLAAAGFHSLEKFNLPGIRISRVVGVLIIFVLGLNVIQVGVNTINRDALKLQLGLTTEENFLEKNLGMFELVNQGIRELPPNSKVLMLWEGRTYYCLPKCEGDEIVDRWISDVRKFEDSENILRNYQDTGYTHLLYYKTGADFIRQTDDRYQANDWQILEDLLSGLTETTNFNDFYILYSLK